MELIPMSVLLAALGLVNLVPAILILVGGKSAAEYLKKSHKALLWKKILGHDKALFALRFVFAPIGILLGVVQILLGLLLLVAGGLIVAFPE